MIGFAFAILAAVCSPGDRLQPLGSPEGTPKVTETMVPMADGVKLYTRAIVPGTSGKFPCVFQRTPYPGADDMKVPYPASAAQGNTYVKRGYVAVTQHCRGFGRSEGFCRVYEEREDGLATLEWIRRQPWYNGEIFLVGASYTTSVHLLYLSVEPPDIKGAALSIQTDRMYFRNYRNGCNYAVCNVDWLRYMMKRQYPDARSVRSALRRPYADIAKRIFGEDVPKYTGFLMHTEYDDFWKNDPRTDVMNHIKFPVLLQEGLYDFYIEGMTSMWERMLPEWKAKSIFVLKPNGHGSKALKDTPIPSAHDDPGLSDVDFFDSIRKGHHSLPVGKVICHSIGADAWQTNVWPAVVGYHTLNFPTGERSWIYDPRGPRIPNMADGRCQQVWQAGSRTDATEFVSAPFDREVSFFGKPCVRMPVKSDCEDTQFFVRIDLVSPEGSAWNICQTIASLRNRKPNYRPGEVVDIELEFPLTAFTVKPGWAVRLDVCSDGGVYVQHANVVKHWALVTDDEVRVAHNAIAPGEVTLKLPMTSEP